MTERKDLIRKSKHLAFLLRHDTDYAFDENGWREVRDLVRNHGYSKAELEEIVATNDKQRYEFNAQHTKIRARHGSRLYVHLSPTVEIARKVGLRHGTPYVLGIDCKAMAADGIKFFLSNNGVWLTKYIALKYLKRVIFGKTEVCTNH